MFAVNLKLKPNKKLIIFAAVFAVILVSFTVLHAVSKKPSAKIERNGREISLICADSVSFLERLGYKTDGKAVKKSVIVPSEFNETYSEYNELQKETGFDLTPYSGKTAEQITVPLKDAKARYAVILAIGDRVIGGHLANGEYGSGMLPLF